MTVHDEPSERVHMLPPVMHQLAEWRCRKCGEVFTEAFFRKDRDNRRGSLPALRSTCVGCELTARTAAKMANREREKARRTTRHHARKFVKAGLASSQEDFVERYGWDINQMAHDIRHARSNGCPYCFEQFAEMENGLSDCTLDIIDPEKLPYYTTNVRWCCQTCNTQKQRTDPQLWAAKLADWGRWKKRQVDRSSPFDRGQLF